MQAGEPTRRRDLDRLRILACLSTFAYHAVQVFDRNPFYHVKSNTLSPAIDVAARLLHAVRMPLFFLIAGMVGYLALQRYDDRQFLRQRAWRLLPPFLFGIVLLTPWVKYIELVDGRSIDWRGIIQHGLVAPEPLVLLRRYFTQLRWFTWSHMWFPLYLLLLSALLLPVMRALQRRSPPPPAGLVVALVPVALIAIELALRPVFPNHVPNLIADWASMAVYAVVLIAGAALVRWPDAERALQRGLPVSAMVAALGAWLFLGEPAWPLGNIGRALTLAGALALMVGLGPWLARGRIAGESYFGEAVLPLYVLHHVPLLVIALAVKDQPWPVLIRYLVIVLGAFAVTLAVYHWVIRPVGPLRFWLGLPPLARRTVAA